MSGKCNILLAHSSNMNAFSKAGMDIAICGDIHGGQIRFPILGAIYNNGIWFPEISNQIGSQYTKGVYQKEKFHLVISSGLGNYPIPVRLFNLPEVMEIKVVP